MRSETGGGPSSPPYPHHHTGPCIVAGAAWCLDEDLAKARERFGDVPVIAVNAAAREVKALALFSQHPERMVSQRWIEFQRKLHGGFTVHGCKYRSAMPWIDHWWEQARGGGSSAWGARKLAGLMGFAPVVLCGAPLAAGNYTGYRPGQFMTDQRVIERFRREIAADTDWHDGVVSMSGWTAEFLC